MAHDSVSARKRTTNLSTSVRRRSIEMFLRPIVLQGMVRNLTRGSYWNQSQDESEHKHRAGVLRLSGACGADSAASKSTAKATFKLQVPDRRLTGSGSRDLTNIGRLRSFVSLDDFEFNFVAFLQAFVTLACDGAIVDEYIRSPVAPQEAISFRVVEPLDGAFDTFHLFSLSLYLFCTSPRIGTTLGCLAKCGDIV